MAAEHGADSPGQSSASSSRRNLKNQRSFNRSSSSSSSSPDKCFPMALFFCCCSRNHRDTTNQHAASSVELAPAGEGVSSESSSRFSNSSVLRSLGKVQDKVLLGDLSLREGIGLKPIPEHVVLPEHPHNASRNTSARKDNPMIPYARNSSKELHELGSIVSAESAQFPIFLDESNEDALSTHYNQTRGVPVLVYKKSKQPVPPPPAADRDTGCWCGTENGTVIQSASFRRVCPGGTGLAVCCDS